MSMLAEKLLSCREERGWSLRELAEKACYDRADLHKMEQGTKLGSEYIIGKLDALYGTGDLLSTLRLLAKAEGTRDKYRAYMRLEATATVLHEYAAATIPGLLQTEAYARELIETAPRWDDGEVSQAVANSLERQGRLTTGAPPHYRGLLDESAFQRKLSDPESWRTQLSHLLHMSSRPNVRLQLVPFSAGLHDLAGGSLALLWQADGSNSAYQESSKTGDLIEEPEDVAELRLSYDLLRDSAFSPDETRSYIKRALEEI
ncbi:transcriptional regulator [Streptomyces sp. NHF165]|uniref:helix-turn-helix domain-containing protein n=1 Tax=Streptomyces sp. NHF165 TaxID=2175864 RepID=UPI00132EF3B7|nr:helix-turn-helix transcriptional regulator [Streptomyces sp. NHF165]QHF97658.1 transcriptional regulator [Streptomyces sp. NHF165]